MSPSSSPFPSPPPPVSLYPCAPVSLCAHRPQLLNPFTCNPFIPSVCLSREGGRREKARGNWEPTGWSVRGRLEREEIRGSDSTGVMGHVTAQEALETAQETQVGFSKTHARAHTPPRPPLALLSYSLLAPPPATPSCPLPLPCAGMCRCIELRLGPSSRHPNHLSRAKAMTMQSSPRRPSR